MKIVDIILENTQTARAEVVTIVTSGRWDIAVTDHVLQRANERDIQPNELSTTLTKVNQAKAKIKQLVPGEIFWVHDNTDNVSICLRPHTDPTKLQIKTVLRGRPLVRPHTPVFEIR